MLRPNTPLFSFMIAMLFHHGIVAVVIFARFSSAGMLRRSPRLDVGEAVADQPPAGSQQPVVLAEAARADRVEGTSTPSPPVIRATAASKSIVR